MSLLPPSLLRWSVEDNAADSAQVMADARRGLVLLPGADSGTVTGAPRSVRTARVVASWQADTPAGTYIEIFVRAAVGPPAAPRWTRWYTLGSWASDAARRYSTEGQADADGSVATDTLRLVAPAHAVQWRVALHGAAGRSPALRGIALAVEPAETADEGSAGAVAPLPVPELSQMVYPNGGRVWCSPTSLTMLLAYWHARTNDPRLAPFTDPQAVPELVAPAVYDAVYEGTGNWPFNTAFAATLGLEGYVLQLGGLGDLRRLLAAGVPLALSIQWQPGQLDGAPVGHSNGHLVVAVGLTEAGDVIVNDPAADPRTGAAVRRVYPREQLLRAWSPSGRAAYLVYPPGWLAEIPATV